MTIYPSTGRVPDPDDNRRRKLQFNGDHVIGNPGWNIPPTAQQTMHNAQLAALQRKVFGDRDPDEVVAEGQRREREHNRIKANVRELEAWLHEPAIPANRRVPNPPKAAAALHRKRQDAIAAAKKRRKARKVLTASGETFTQGGPHRWVKLSNGSFADLATFGSVDEAERISRLGR